MIEQQGDVLLFQTNDGGDINVSDGVVEMSGGLETAVYLSLFGGNEEDDKSDNTPFSWWGNLSEIDPAQQYRSETQNLVQSLPLTSANLRRVEDAAERDLAWLITNDVATGVSVTASIPDVNSIKIVVEIEAVGQIEFIENWKADI